MTKRATRELAYGEINASEWATVETPKRHVLELPIKGARARHVCVWAHVRTRVPRGSMRAARARAERTRSAASKGSRGP